MTYRPDAQLDELLGKFLGKVIQRIAYQILHRGGHSLQPASRLWWVTSWGLVRIHCQFNQQGCSNENIQQTRNKYIKIQHSSAFQCILLMSETEAVDLPLMSLQNIHFIPPPAWNGQIHVLAHSADALHWVAGHNWAPNEPMIQSSSPGRQDSKLDKAKSWWEWCKGNFTNLTFTGIIQVIKCDKLI